MNLPGTIHLGSRYVRRRWRTVSLLVAAITLSIFLPVAILIVVQDAEHHLRSRADSTPLLMGAPGSPLELVFNGVYFAEPDIEPITLGEATAVGAEQMARVIPIHARYEARGYRIVGTDLDYFAFRGLRCQAGSLFARLGDCVLGASIASQLDLGVGDRIVSTPEQVFDLAGVYPLKMRITGVLEPTGHADDRAVFVDLKTAWIIAGIGHGHVEPTTSDDTVLSQDGANVALNASVVEYAEITEHNIDSFHFHGDLATFPVTSAIVVPRDDKAATILLGRFVGKRKAAQLVRPDAVVSNLLATVFEVRNLVVAALVAIGLMAAAIALLVFSLSNRLRAREFESLAYIGADPGTVRALVLFEALFVGLVSLLLTGLFVLVLQLVVPRLLPLLIA